MLPAAAITENNIHELYVKKNFNFQFRNAIMILYHRKESQAMNHGQYVNPGNSRFQRILNAKYIDKTGMIGLINARIDSPQGMVCISRPRRFGKSYLY